MIERNSYLNELIDKRGNGLVKVITGIRRCGKSYLLFNIYHKYLNSIGVDDNQIIEIALDDDENAMYRDPVKLGEYVRGRMTDRDKTYYIFLDEIQKVSTVKNPYVDDPENRLCGRRPRSHEKAECRRVCYGQQFKDVILGYTYRISRQGG